MKLSAKKVRSARAFLRRKGIRTTDISPRDFAAAAEQRGTSFAETLRLVASLQLGTQGKGPAPIAEKLARRKA